MEYLSLLVWMMMMMMDWVQSVRKSLVQCEFCDPVDREDAHMVWCSKVPLFGIDRLDFIIIIIISLSFCCKLFSEVYLHWAQLLKQKRWSKFSFQSNKWT